MTTNKKPGDKPVWRRGKFAIEDGPVIEGYTHTCGNTWNGWACPVFDFENANKAIAAYASEGEWDRALAAFVIPPDTDASGDEPAIYRPTQISVEGLGRFLTYAIGSQEWIWSEVGAPGWSNEALALLHETLSAFGDEEESVQEEHADLISKIRGVVKDSVNLAELAMRFIVELADDIGDDKLEEVRRRNAANGDDKPSGVGCASHDFCDANMVMHAAYAYVSGVPADSIAIGDQIVMDQMGKAWDMAQAAHFDSADVKGGAP